ncbi:hypothetical protein FB45DRAFT_1066418 [Roridomyces roridus]|uniref:Chitin-binding type-4 domain-containing protein n=1 Tax=Roridomyces roridus TaxID=1738132 RepID=A0AAD7B4I0_9AGAR|nr:hypothetical protein FB45DRAFT_1066418 [Roridomyces roridus]
MPRWSPDHDVICTASLLAFKFLSTTTLPPRFIARPALTTIFQRPSFSMDDGLRLVSRHNVHFRPRRPRRASVTHTVPLKGYTGQQTILARWNIADTPNAFYSCLDLNIGGSCTGSGSGAGNTSTAAASSASGSTASVASTPPASTGSVAASSVAVTSVAASTTVTSGAGASTPSPSLSSTPSITTSASTSSSTSANAGPAFDPAGAKNVGNGVGTQFIGGQCLSAADCASGCCAGPSGICSGVGAQTQAGKTGCGFVSGGSAVSKRMHRLRRGEAHSLRPAVVV